MFAFKDKQGKELSASEAGQKIINRFNNWLLDFELMLLRWLGHFPSHSIRKFFYSLAGIKIGRGSTIHMWANFYYPKNIIIGKDTVIGDHCFLDGREKIMIGNHVSIASQVLIYNSQHDIDDPAFKAIEKPVSIADYAFIGPRAIILPGVKIGQGAVVGAGAVVASDIPEGVLAAGVPAKVIRKRNLTSFNYNLGRARLFQ